MIKPKKIPKLIEADKVFSPVEILPIEEDDLISLEDAPHTDLKARVLAKSEAARIKRLETKRILASKVVKLVKEATLRHKAKERLAKEQHRAKKIKALDQ